MQILPINPTDNPTPDALGAFLETCRQAAVRDQHPKLVSITIAVDALDPLAVLETIYEPREQHFYTEHPAQQTAIAGAEALLEHTADGPGRFSQIQNFIDETLAHTIAVGPLDAPFAGPHFFTALAFLDRQAADAPFPAARAFVPRWQVAVNKHTTTAVANLLVTPDSDLPQLIQRTLRAHQKFTRFDYDKPPPTTTIAALPSPAKIQLAETNDYPAAVRAAVADIAQNHYQKIVLARQLVATADAPLHPLRLLNKLRERYPDCHAFSNANASGQSFIGASPELLARVSAGQLQTEALAGSIQRGRSASEDAALSARLLRDPKNLVEHRHVLDAIRDSLAPLNLRLDHPDAPALRRLANVQHLHTPITAPLPTSCRLLDILSKLHPTPAVGGLPRGKTIPRIRELEQFDRNLYAGALGWINCKNEGEFFVGIRSALIDGNTARLYAGAGIVADSDPEAEFAETTHKFRALLDTLLSD